MSISASRKSVLARRTFFLLPSMFIVFMERLSSFLFLLTNNTGLFFSLFLYFSFLRSAHKPLFLGPGVDFISMLCDILQFLQFHISFPHIPLLSFLHQDVLDVSKHTVNFLQIGLYNFLINSKFVQFISSFLRHFFKLHTFCIIA